MSNKRREELGAGPREAHPLPWSSLTPWERSLLGRIHARLSDISSTTAKIPAARSREPWCEPEADPRGRVMVISGDRGSGKTTLLVTLIEQLNQARRPNAQGGTQEIVANGVRPLGILDFDPLPNGVSLHAWLVQAWLPLVEHLETSAARSHSGQVQCAPLREMWDNLFQQAVIAWTDVADGRSIVDRLFDHRDQLRNYQELTRAWRAFVDDVILRLQIIDPDAEVILIAIDDVDLQVKMNIDLIHAMRLLRHPRVVYLVTADLIHTEEVIFLDFLRQHRALRGQASLALSDEDRLIKRCQDLAKALLEKAYPEVYTFRTEAVSLSAMLEWREGVLMDILNTINVDKIGVGTWLANRTAGATGSNESFMQWRGMQRILDEVGVTAEGEQATLVLKHLLAQGDARQHVEVISKKGHGAVIDFGLAGDLRVAAVPAWFTGSRNNRIVIGTELTNSFTAPDGRVLDAPSSLLARELHEETEDPDTGAPKSGTGRRGPVQADRIILSIGAVLVWTRWTNAPRNAIFLWPFARFPRIPTLRDWLREWEQYTSTIRDSQDPDEKLAYAWLLCQLRWSNVNAGESPKWEQPLTGSDWDSLLSILIENSKADVDFRYWFERAFPLLALPEFGLPENVQEYLIKFIERDVLGKMSPVDAWDWFMSFEAEPHKDHKPRRGERHQCAMNALYAAWDESRDGDEPKDEDGDNILLQAERLYPEAPWYQLRERLRERASEASS